MNIINSQDVKYLGAKMGKGFTASVEKVTHNGKTIAKKSIKINLKFKLPDAIEELVMLSITSECPLFLKFYGYQLERKVRVHIYLECMCHNLLEFRTNYSISIEHFFYMTAFLVLVLEFLRRNRIVHNDIKLENIMINSRGHLKVIDFGFSKFHCSPLGTLTGNTHPYCPIERINFMECSYATDVWSAGICLYHIVYNEFPFNEDDLVTCYTDRTEITYLGADMITPQVFNEDEYETDDEVDLIEVCDEEEYDADDEGEDQVDEAPAKQSKEDKIVEEICNHFLDYCIKTRLGHTGDILSEAKEIPSLEEYDIEGIYCISSPFKLWREKRKENV